MKRLMLITTLSLGLATTALAQDLLPKSIGPSVLPTPAINTRAGVTAPCEGLLHKMHDAREDTRAGRVWTPEQVATWNAWKTQCDTDTWRKRLAAIPPPADYKFVPGRSVDGYMPGDYGYDPAADRARAGLTGHTYYVPSFRSYTNCIPLRNGSVNCYTTGGW
jgi:hypothetical protein